MVYLAEGDYVDFRVITHSLYGSSQIHATMTCMYIGTT